MEQKLSTKHYITIGVMLFGMFFGAGNLIFPIFMGQNAGANFSQATLGFIITGVIVPFLGSWRSVLVEKKVSSKWQVKFILFLDISLPSRFI